MLFCVACKSCWDEDKANLFGRNWENQDYQGRDIHWWKVFVKVSESTEFTQWPETSRNTTIHIIHTWIWLMPKPVSPDLGVSKNDAKRLEGSKCAERFDSWWGHSLEIKWKWPPHYNVLQISNNFSKLWQAQLILKAKATRPSMRGGDTGTSLVKALSPVGTYEDNSQSVEYRRHAGWHPTSLTSGHPATYHILWASCACHHVIMSCASGSLCASPLGLILRKLANQT